MCWWCKKEKSPLQLLEEELKRQHKNHVRLGGSYGASEEIRRLNEALISITKQYADQKVLTRLSAAEDAITDLYLTGKGKP